MTASSTYPDYDEDFETSSRVEEDPNDMISVQYMHEREVKGSKRKSRMWVLLNKGKVSYLKIWILNQKNILVNVYL